MNLRKKIEPSTVPAYLKTVYGVGYKLADKVVSHAS
jgi:DNA-binding response OmpR family regulator